MRTVRVIWLPLLCALTAAAMIRDWYNDPWPPVVAYDDAYGHNGEGALSGGLVAIEIELAVLLAILRPWSYDRSWGRSLAASILLAPWLLISTMVTMHAGGVMVLHALWLWLVMFVLGPMFLWSAIAAARAPR